MPCWKSSDCLDAQEKTVHVDIELAGLQPSSLEPGQLVGLLDAYASELAAACDVPKASVVDADGANATVSLGPDGTVSAFVLSIKGLTAHDLSSRLYASSFRYAVGNATRSLLGEQCGVQVVAVSMDPRVFVRTTTTPATTTEATTSSTDTTVDPETTTAEVAVASTRHRGEGGAGRHDDIKDDPAVDNYAITLGGYSSGAASASAWLVVALALVSVALQ